MKIDQSTFIKNLVINEGLEKSNANIISMKASSVIEMLDFGDYDITNFQKYQFLIGKLIYLLYRTRPNIAFAVSQLSRYNADSQKNHFQATKRVVRYLKGTMQMGLIFV